jgi:hypothetical protein
MHRRITILHAAIVTRADELSVLAENRSTDGQAAFG